MLRHGLAICLGVMLTRGLEAADWPQWRGPERNGISEETGLLKEWPAAGPKLLWQVKDLGEGYSTPAVVDGRIYMIANQGLDNEYVIALNEKDGKEIWKTTIGKVGNPQQRPPYPGARSTPTVDGDVLYALGSDGDLVCMETDGGKVRWQKQLRQEFGGVPGEWAYSESPLVDGNLLVCTPGGKEATLLALQKETGDIVWKSAVPGEQEAAYASIITATIDGVKQYIQFLQKGLVGVNAKTGEFLWQYDRTAEGSPANIPTPVEKDGYVYSAAGRSGGGLVKVTMKEGKATAEQVYFAPNLPTAIGGTVLIGDYLYGTSRESMSCVKFKTGEIAWQQRSIGAAGICYADGMLYLHGENGEVALVEATASEYREKGRFTPPNPPDHGRSKTWAYPVLSGGKLYIHDWGTLWCYEVKE